MVHSLDSAWSIAARHFARRLGSVLGPKLLSVQVVGRGARTIQERPDQDLDILVILTQWSRPLVRRVHAIGAEVEQEFESGLALKITSPAQIEHLGARGTPVWDLLETGIPLLSSSSEAPRLALPSKVRTAPPIHRLSRTQAAEKTNSRLLSAQTLLASDQLADAVSLAHSAMLSLAKASLPREDLQGRRESELYNLLVRAAPDGASGHWATRLRDLRKLRSSLDLGCQALEDPQAAQEAVATAIDLAKLLLDSQELQASSVKES